jgi:hypothetical protein
MWVGGDTTSLIRPLLNFGIELPPWFNHRQLGFEFPS